MTAQRQTLPPELTDIIIDYLFSDVRALKACSLVCKAWLPSCRCHLFRSIHLDLSLPSKSLAPFFNHLAGRPADSQSLSPSPSQSHFHTTLRTLTLRCEPQRRHDLSRLCGLRSLRSINLCYWYTAMPDSRWFRSAVGVRCLALTCCRIDFPGFAALARQLPRLETLKLANVSWKDRFEIEKAVLGGRMLPCLRELRLGPHSSPVVPALTAMIARGVVGRVQQVRLDEVESRHAQAAGTLLRTVGTSLRELVISAKTMLRESPSFFFAFCRNLLDAKNVTENAKHAFALGENTSLTSVHFTDLVDPCHGSGFMGQFSFDWVVDLLEQLPSSVERIMFSIWLIPGDRLGLDESSDSADWVKLVRALMRLDGLKTAEFRLGAEEAHRGWLRKKCEERFPELKSVLKVTSFEVEEADY
ncbi:hypothetical protein FPV67DRAFT_1677915 [Lyophyllum atratum]|nr:hypothetical protein FPV67DRAFT_1677915 [Lyophyllum atratum]